MNLPLVAPLPAPRRSTLHFPSRLVAMAALAWVVSGCDRAKAPEVAVSTPGAVSASAPMVADATHQATDIDVTTAVKTALLREPTLQGFDITVVTTKGDARLTGVVDTQAQIDLAGTIARSINGVHALHDELTLRPR